MRPAEGAGSSRAQVSLWASLELSDVKVEGFGGFGGFGGFPSLTHKKHVGQHKLKQIRRVFG